MEAFESGGWSSGWSTRDWAPTQLMIGRPELLGFHYLSQLLCPCSYQGFSYSQSTDLLNYYSCSVFLLLPPHWCSIHNLVFRTLILLLVLIHHSLPLLECKGSFFWPLYPHSRIRFLAPMVLLIPNSIISIKTTLWMKSFDCCRQKGQPHFLLITLSLLIENSTAIALQPKITP